MILISGKPYQQSNMWPADSVKSSIIQRMMNDPAVHSYQSIDGLSFELDLRTNIISSARAMNQSDAQFAVFKDARCNPQYWQLTIAGGFQLKYGVKPSDAIQDIYLNSSQYAFECATAMIIIYYHAVLNTVGEHIFNHLFQNILLYSWHADSDLGLKLYVTHHFIPGDVVYFNNPDFDPKTPQWKGENAVVLEDGTHFGHGVGIKTAEQMIDTLNNRRKPESTRSAYLMNQATRPDFKHLANLSTSQRGFPIYKYQNHVVQHNKSSISFDQYISLLYAMHPHKHF